MLDVRPGEGASPKPGDTVVVHWSGYTKGYQVRADPAVYCNAGSAQCLMVVEKSVFARGGRGGGVFQERLQRVQLQTVVKALSGRQVHALDVGPQMLCHCQSATVHGRIRFPATALPSADLQPADLPQPATGLLVLTDDAPLLLSLSTAGQAH